MAERTIRPRPTAGRPKGSTSSTSSMMGPILCDAVYPLSVFRSLVGVGHKGLRSMREGGLPICRHGKQGFVIGRDAVEWFAQLPVDHDHGGGEQ